MFGGFFKADLDDPNNPDNDRLIFSKGHASPLLYALYAAAKAIDPVELAGLRKFGSRLEGHPTLDFPYTEVATGSLGQGLSVGVGMSLAAKMDHRSYRVFVLLGDSELAEGSNWEAAALASYYKLSNLIAIVDINRLGQRGETMNGHDLSAYAAKFQAFGWQTRQIDGHDHQEIARAWEDLLTSQTDSPKVILAKTLKGKGVSFLEDQPDWHGKALNSEQLILALKELPMPDSLNIPSILKPTA